MRAVTLPTPVIDPLPDVQSEAPAHALALSGVGVAGTVPTGV